MCEGPFRSNNSVRLSAARQPVATASGGWTLEAPAKVNLFLEILRRRSDGYHDLVSLFQTISLCDTLSVHSGEGLSLSCDSPGIPLDESNLVLRAARRLQQEAGVSSGAAFHLIKRIPDGGGLGGGSSDAAAALMLCNRLWRLGMTRGELARLGAQIGSDVPFFLHGGVCLCEGRGEIITPRPDLLPLPVAVAAPDWKISTIEAYRNLLPEEFQQRSPRELLRCWQEFSGHFSVEGDEDSARQDILRRIHAASFNRFEETAFRLEARQRPMHEALRASGWLPRLSGSGSCCWLLANGALPATCGGIPNVRILACR